MAKMEILALLLNHLLVLVFAVVVVAAHPINSVQPIYKTLPFSGSRDVAKSTEAWFLGVVLYNRVRISQHRLLSDLMKVP